MSTLDLLKERCQEWKAGTGKYPAGYEAEQIEKLIDAFNALMELPMPPRVAGDVRMILDEVMPWT